VILTAAGGGGGLGEGRGESDAGGAVEDDAETWTEAEEADAVACAVGDVAAVPLHPRRTIPSVATATAVRNAVPPSSRGNGLAPWLAS